MAEKIEVEVVYGTAEQQHLLRLSVENCATVRQVVLASGLDKLYPALDLANASVGIFGKQVANAQEHLLKAGDRIEVYRPLLADPKEVRRLRAAKAKAKQNG